MVKRTIALIGFISVFFIAATVPPQKPSLVILIAIDQMRADYLDRFQNQFTGGLKQAYTQGFVYTNATLNYALSLTGPGHATLSTGTYPHTSGISSNEWVDPQTKKSVYCVADPSARAVNDEGGNCSPKNLLTDTIGDWLKKSSPASKVFSAGGKDRSAILLGGHKADQVYWYNNKNGHMVTSTYYVSQLPAWVAAFNTNDWIAKNVPAAWTKLKPDSAYASDSPDKFPAENPWGSEDTEFPHPFNRSSIYSQISDSPYWDMYILEFAKAAVQQEKLGQRNVPDLLCVALSGTDYIGHSFGPDSQEMHDQLLRLDIALGSFLADVEKTVGKGKVLVAISADHGVLSLPEYLTQIKHQQARRIAWSSVQTGIQALNITLEKQYGIQQPLIQMSEESEGTINYSALVNVRVNRTAFEDRIRQGMLQINGVSDVYFRDELESKTPPKRPYIDFYRNTYSPARGGDFEVRYCERCLISDDSTGTTHGSPYAYDTRVPIVFWGAGVRTGKSADPVHTVDVAPTLAHILGISYPSTVEGTVLKQLK